MVNSSHLEGLTPGGELYDYLLKRKRLKEPIVQRMFAQLCGAVTYIHRSGCVHRYND
jgi:serine/threonine protein kinase